MRIDKLLFVLLFVVIGCKDKNVIIAIAKDVEKKPNVLILYPDQLRRYSAGFWSEENYKNHVLGAPDPVVTPNMDKLAKKGAVFTQAVSNFPLCSPARGMLLSGMYPEQNGIWNNCRNDREESLRDDIPTITDLFFGAGYNTSYFGKCHWLKNEPLFTEDSTYVGTKEAPGGYYMNRYDTYVPPGKSRHNIEYFYQSIRDQHFNPQVYSNDPNVIMGKKDGELHQPKIFSPKNESDKIIGYLNNKNNVRDTSKPFFMMWSINPPHNPWDDENTDMKTLNKFYGTDKYPMLDTLVVRENADLKTAHYARHYFANVTSVDHYIGLVLDKLKEMGELENTIVILSADHGEMMGSHGQTGKNTFETESLGIPFIVHWPKELKVGMVSDVLFSVTDVLPTVMGLAGLKEEIPIEVQGTDFSKLLVNTSEEKIDRPEGVLLMLTNARGILTDRYTLCLKQNETGQKTNEVSTLEDVYIYDNLKDPYQLTKLKLEERPNVANKLLELLGAELKRTNDPWYQQRKHENLIVYL